MHYSMLFKDIKDVAPKWLILAIGLFLVVSLVLRTAAALDGVADLNTCQTAIKLAAQAASTYSIEHAQAICAGTAS